MFFSKTRGRLARVGSLVACALLVAAVALFQACAYYRSTLDWAVAMIDMFYYYDVSEEDVRAAGLEGLNNNVLDRYSEYYTAEEYAAVISSNAGGRSGVGISFSYIPAEYGAPIGGGLYISEVLGGSPADIAGVRAGMFVTAVKDSDGVVTQLGSSQELSSFIAGRADGEDFTLVTDRGEFTLAKGAYKTSYCRMATNDGEWRIRYDGNGEMQVVFSESQTYACLPQGTAYLNLSQFYGDAPSEMAALIERFNAEGCTSLILDLRNNGGGYVDVMQKLSHLFLAEREGTYDVAMTADYKDGSIETFYVAEDFSHTDAGHLSADCTVTVLANNGTASASEALIGVLVSNGVAGYDDIYVSDLSQSYLAAVNMQDKNCRTYGKGIMQTTFEYQVTGEALKLTVARINWPNGTCIHDVGIGEAQGCNTAKAEWSVTYGDEELQSVVRMLSADQNPAV